MSEQRQFTQDQVDIALIQTDIRSIKKTVDEINSKLTSNYVTKDELKLLSIQVDILQKIVYGVVGIILTSVVSGIVLFYINTSK